MSTRRALGIKELSCDKENIDVELVVSSLTVPSGLIPCSRQNNSQHANPTRTPACPTCIHMNSPCDGGGGGGGGGDSTGLTTFRFSFLDFFLRLSLDLFLLPFF